MTSRARALRKRQTEAESCFWENCRKRRLFRLKINRQFPIKYKLIGHKASFFIADFYCHAHKLIIEIDGGIHLSRQKYDQERTEILISMGFQIIRFSNEDVLNNWEKVEESIKELIDSSTSKSR